MVGERLHQVVSHLAFHSSVVGLNAKRTLDFCRNNAWIRSIWPKKPKAIGIDHLCRIVPFAKLVCVLWPKFTVRPPAKIVTHVCAHCSLEGLNFSRIAVGNSFRPHRPLLFGPKPRMGSIQLVKKFLVSALLHTHRLELVGFRTRVRINVAKPTSLQIPQLEFFLQSMFGQVDEFFDVELVR